MNGWFLAAAVLTAIVCVVHVSMTRRITRPLLSSDLDTAVRFGTYHCWHVVTLVLVAAAVGFGVASAAPSAASLGLFLSIVALAFGAWSVAMIAIHRLRPFRFPQWAALLPVGALGLIGALT